jgi:hypothetical protein
MKYSACIILVLLISQSCAQSKIKNQSKNMNNNKSLDTVLTLKKYDTQPLYKVTISSNQHCKIVINNIPFFVKNNKEQDEINFFINSAILNAGKQEVKIILFTEDNGSGAQPNNLGNEALLNFKIVETAWVNGILSKPKEIINYELTSTTEGVDFDTLQQYQKVVNFDAMVPYTCKGWLESADLNKEDKTLLKEALIKQYNISKRYLESKEGEKFSNELINAERFVYQANYFSLEEALGKRKKWIDFINSGVVLDAIEDCDMEISENGKLVSLRRTDKLHRGEGVLRIKYTNNIGQQRTIVYDVLFHKPQNTSELQIIWFNMLDKN